MNPFEERRKTKGFGEIIIKGDHHETTKILQSVTTP
jgi:hypothetical protein